MKENLYNSEHKATNKLYREKYDHIFRKTNVIDFNEILKEHRKIERKKMYRALKSMNT